jgi:hypothetical protein
VFGEDGTGVESVMIGGRMVLDHGRFTTIDPAKLRLQAEAAVARLAAETREGRALSERLAPLIGQYCSGLAGRASSSASILERMTRDAFKWQVVDSSTRAYRSKVLEQGNAGRNRTYRRDRGPVARAVRTGACRSDTSRLQVLFHADSYGATCWRSAGRSRRSTARALSRALLKAHAQRASPSGFKSDPDRTGARWVTRAGTDAIEAIFRFETAVGRGSGVLRLIPDGGDGDALMAWTLLTTLEALKGFEEQIGRFRPKGQSYSRDFRGPNWLDLRKSRPRMPTAIRSCWSWAAVRRGSRSPRA